MPITEMEDGCADANSFIEEQSSCWRCPFGDCIYDLKPKEKSLIFVANIVWSVLKCHDKGMNIDRIIQKHKQVTKAQVHALVSKREQLVEKLSRYAPYAVR